MQLEKAASQTGATSTAIEPSIVVLSYEDLGSCLLKPNVTYTVEREILGESHAQDTTIRDELTDRVLSVQRKLAETGGRHNFSLKVFRAERKQHGAPPQQYFKAVFSYNY